MFFVLTIVDIGELKSPLKIPDLKQTQNQNHKSYTK